MDHDDLVAGRAGHPAWRLLRADNAPLVLSFLGRVFVDENIRGITLTDLVGRLDDELFGLRERHGPDVYPRAARAYLDEWSTAEVGWLRKYYPPGSDEPHLDATPSVERALTWVRQLQARTFVGTESRLNTAFDLLRQMVFGAETDPTVRIAELRRRRDEIDADIARLEAGHLDLLDTAAQRDRYQQFAGLARELLGDFRQVEENFRDLDRELRERIAGWTGSKGDLLDDILGARAGIDDSDQGRSFHAFYDFLLSATRQDEFADLLTRVHELPELPEVDDRLRHVHHDWLDAGERTQTGVRMLSEQLRRFLDDQVWLENRRVVDLLRLIEHTALAVRETPPSDDELGLELDELHPTIALPMERPLYTPAARISVDSSDIRSGAGDFEADTLFDQVYVDTERLRGAVWQMLGGRGQVDLAEVLRTRPLEQGLAELVGYFALSDPGFDVVFDDSALDDIHWTTEAGERRVASVPRVTYAARRRTGGT